MTNKFVKARCKKTGRWMSLEVKQFGSVWKVVNMTDLSDSDAAKVASEVRQASFETNDTLLACQRCGHRKVGGCGCSKKLHSCSRSMGYHFDCVYCEELEIDYSLPTRPESGAREGDVVKLAQGQEVVIKYADDRPLSKIYVGVGWDPALFGPQIDVDSSVVVMDGRTGQKDVVYYGDLKHSSGCVVHHGDNLTGEDIPNTDDENISVWLDKVPPKRDRLVFVLNVYKCTERRQTFGGIRNLYIRLYDPDSKKALVEYRVTGNFSSDTALIIGMAYRKGQSWVFKAIGRGSKAKSVSDLADECTVLCR